MKLTIIYDNENYLENLENGWGFSCVIESKKERILFDTGWKGNILAENMKKLNLGFGIEDIGIVILSHQHWDHIGGLPYIMNKCRKLKIFILKSFSEHMKEDIKKQHSVIEISKAQKITESIYTTGEIGDWIKEQSIMIETKNGLLVITGCAHPGLDNILENASRLGNIYGVLGGFHDFRNLDVLENLDLIVPCHCTRYKKEIKSRFPDKTITGGVGLSLRL